MKDEEFDALRRRIIDTYHRWRNVLDLDQWEVTHVYYRDAGEFKDEHGSCSASCNANWPYLLATVSYNMLALTGLDDESLEYVVVHELCHILVSQMQTDESNKDNVERVTTLLGRAFIQTRDAARDA